MCGICGFASKKHNSDQRFEIVNSMAKSLSNRGPDETGYWSEKYISFAHTRLAISDPSNGHQPMVRTESGRLVALTFGGEIYNYVELRAALQKKGRTFSTRSDTEVLINCYLEYGMDMLSHLRGMFAIAIWDDNRQELILARDPLGIKPLYYSHKKDFIAFGSEPKALFQIPEISRVVDNLGVCELLGMWPYKTPGKSIYADLDEVKPGEIVTWSPTKLKRDQYWSLNDVPDRKISYSDAVDHTRDMLFDVVKMQSRADVPISYCISGGLDSTAIASMSRKIASKNNPINTYSVGYDDPTRAFAKSAFRPELDEEYIGLAQKHLGSSHTHIELNEEKIHSSLNNATIARDHPDTGDMDASLLLLFSGISNDGLKVSLVGEGADELFGGYPWFKGSEKAHTEFPWRKYLCLHPETLRAGFRQDIRLDEYVNDSFNDAISSAPRFETENPSLRGFREMNYLDLTRFLPGQLDRMDKASMYNSVEARVPFCDHKLVEFVWSLPIEYKVNGTFEKQLLRDSVSTLVEESIRDRAKASYPTLGSKSHDKFIRDSIRRIKHDKESALIEFFDFEKIENMIDSKVKVSSRESIWLGRILSLYRWEKIYRPSINF